MVVNVVDSIMGSGKSTWARNYMNSHPEKKWLFVTPYLKEIEKTENVCNMLALHEPKVGHTGSHNKSEDLIALIYQGKNIVTTHSLFLRIKQDNELLMTIKSMHYCLIIDETLDVIRHEKISRDDINALVAYGTCKIDEKTKEVSWLKEYSGNFSNMMDLSKTGTFFSYQEQALVWLYRPEIFMAFDSVYLLTYLFEGSRMKCYFDFYNDIEYEFYYVEGREIIKGKTKNSKEKAKLLQLIDIYDGHLNDVANGKYSYYSLSKNWYSSRKNRDKQIQVQKNAYNYLHNIQRATSGKSGNALYTTFMDVHKKKPLISYKKSFLQCSQKSTNDYDGKINLAYLINVFEDPEITNFFSENEIEYNEDLYALCSMIQWIWRSAIRKGERIHIYIPSQRMRGLLTNWLNEL